MHEHGQPLGDRPADEALLGVEVEDVELVDPGRHDQERALQHGLGRGRVLDQLHDVVAVYDLAGRRGDVDADLEGARIGLPDLELAAAGLDVLRQHLHAAHQVLAVLLQRLAQQFGIRRDEVGGRECAGDLLHVEARLLAGVGVEIVGTVDHRFGPARADQIGLLDEIEHRMRRPVGVGEAGVALVRLDHGLGLLATRPLEHRAPQRQEIARQRGLRLDDLARVGDPLLGDAAQRLDHLAGLVGLPALGLATLDRLQIGGGGLAVFLDEAAHVLGEGVEIGRRHLGRAGRIPGLLPGSPVHRALPVARLLRGCCLLPILVLLRT